MTLAELGKEWGNHSQSRDQLEDRNLPKHRIGHEAEP